ncbi:hypothetical protein [Nostoc sp. LEGE 12450]
MFTEHWGRIWEKNLGFMLLLLIPFLKMFTPNN